MLEMLFVIYFLKPRLLQREKELKSALSRIHGLPDIRATGPPKQAKGPTWSGAGVGAVCGKVREPLSLLAT